MFKKNKNKEKEIDVMSDEPQTNDPATSVVEQIIQDDKEVVLDPPTEPIYTCTDAARRFIVGYKDGWLTGIEAHIKTNNAPLTGTETYFKGWFKSYGAQVK